MIPVRRNRYWLALIVALAMVFTIGGTPALALACGGRHHSAKVAAPVAAEPVQACHAMAGMQACCCGSRASATAVAGPSQQSLPITVSQPGCGCAIQAPTALPASGLKAATVLLTQDLAFLPGSPAVLHLAAPAAWAYAVSANGPPRSPVRSSSPSRAPPAC